MANLYNTSIPNNYSSPPREPDEISLFLQQILLRSSSSSSASIVRQQSCPAKPEAGMVPGPARISATSSGLNPLSGRGFAVANLPSSSAGNLENEPDECDYESEEAVEAFVEETTPKPTPHRSSSKRSRAAEVHNLSEKRRRSRINEKMKALQNLIPNSNKTDKASMLDEAIEYLKQLQLQVQILTMRSGLSLYPIRQPGMLQPSEHEKLANVNMAKAVCMDGNISAPVTDFSYIIGSKSSLEVESSMQPHHFGAFQLTGSSKGFCAENVLPCRPLIEDGLQSNSGAKATTSMPGEKTRQSSNLNGNIVAGGDHLLPNFFSNPVFSSQLNM